MILTDSLADLLNLPERAAGFIVKTIAEGSPADQVGLRGATHIATISGRMCRSGRHRPDRRGDSGQRRQHAGWSSRARWPR
jgi:hypothetical protein